MCGCSCVCGLYVLKDRTRAAVQIKERLALFVHKSRWPFLPSTRTIILEIQRKTYKTKKLLCYIKEKEYTV